MENVNQCQRALVYETFQETFYAKKKKVTIFYYKFLYLS